ncbi:MAG: DUF4245 domain-containing protein [Lacisediminihabitans sp.]
MTEPSGRGPGRIVAELGRPETPEETAARKAETSRQHRANQTLLNLVVALLASLGVVLFLVLVVVRPGQVTAGPVNYQQIAVQAQPTVSETLASPVLPSGWSANAAQLDKGADGVTSWYVGFITPAIQYIGLRQGIRANSSWVANHLNNAVASGTATIGGIDWTVYDQRAASTGPSNLAYSMSATVGSSTLLLYGSAATDEFRTLAAALATQLSTASSR